MKASKAYFEPMTLEDPVSILKALLMKKMIKENNPVCWMVQANIWDGDVIMYLHLNVSSSGRWYLSTVKIQDGPNISKDFNSTRIDSDGLLEMIGEAAVQLMDAATGTIPFSHSDINFLFYRP